MPGKRFCRHVFLPSVAPAALICLYFTPKTVFGCANRGYAALAIAFLATLAAVAATGKGVSERNRGHRTEATWWLVTTLILLTPIALLVGPLG